MKHFDIYSSVLFLVIVFLLFSCNSQHKNTDRAMDIAERVVEEHPDSALALLDSVIIPSQLNKTRYHRYMLLLLQAKDKSYRDVTGDTLIFVTKQYYTERNDLPHAAMAAYYCGRVRFEQQDYKSAMTQYVEAEKYTEDSPNMNLKALIQSAMGAALSKQMLSVQALPHFHRAVEYFRQAGNLKNEMISYQLIGNSCLIKGEADSALHYYNKTLQMAKKLKDSIHIAGIKQNIGILYKELEEDNALAKRNFFEAMKYTGGNDYSRICLKLADIYSTENKMDSAEWYMQQALSHLQDGKDTYMVADIYNTLATIKEREADYKMSAQYYKEYANYQDSIFKETRRITLLDIEKKYKFEQLKNDNMALALEKQHVLSFSAICIIFLLLLGFFLYKRYIKSQKREQEAEQKIVQLMNMAKSVDEKDNSFRNMLLHQFDIIKKTATLERYIQKGDEKSGKLLRRVNKIIYGEDQLNWDMLYKVMNDLHNNLFEHIQEKYPNLDKNEFRICCLTYTDFSSEEISIVMGLSVNTIQMKRTSIRKKLGIPPMGNIQRFLDEIIPH